MDRSFRFAGFVKHGCQVSPALGRWEQQPRITLDGSLIMLLFFLVVIGVLDLTCIANPYAQPWNWTLSPDECLG